IWDNGEAAMHAEGKGRRQTGVGRKRNRPPETPPPTQSRGTLLLLDYIRPPEPVPLASAFFDLHMLVILGGGVRSEAEWRALLHASGFELTRLPPLQPPFSVLEGRRVPGGARDV